MRLRRPVLTVVIAVLVLLTAGGGVAAALAAEPAAKGTTGDGAKHVRGTVTAENGPSWMVSTGKNHTTTVTLTPRTAFGTKKAPATAAQFPVGSQVRVTGAEQGDVIVADRITAPPAGTGTAPPGGTAPAIGGVPAGAVVPGGAAPAVSTALPADDAVTAGTARAAGA